MAAEAIARALAGRKARDPLDGLVEKTAIDPGATFAPDVLERLAALKMAHQVAVWSAAAPGTTIRRTSDRRAAPDPLLTCGTGISASGWPEHYSSVHKMYDPYRGAEIDLVHQLRLFRVPLSLPASP
jgi:hypothetical protein